MASFFNSSSSKKRIMSTFLQTLPTIEEERILLNSFCEVRIPYQNQTVALQESTDQYLLWRQIQKKKNSTKYWKVESSITIDKTQMSHVKIKDN